MTQHTKPIHRTFLILATLLLGVALVAACGPRQHRDLTDQQVRTRVTDRVNWRLDDIEASDAQRLKIQAEVSALVTKFNEVRRIKKPLRAQVAAELMRSYPRPENLRAIADQAAEKLKPLAHQALDAALRSQSVLTPKQRAALADEALSRTPEMGDRAWLVDAVVGQFLDKIDATDAQSTYVFEQKDRLMAEALTLKTAGLKTRSFMIQEFRQDEPDAKAMHGQIDATAARALAFVHEVSNSVAGLAQRLSPEQKKKIQAHVASMRH